ncbi:hypothetical protein MTR_7g060990 [Medicago truncatula]|uniref:Cysteine-rich receptor-like protein kinase n=1 Tax=Medicago truncatula TaxID=3880 RepID=G7L4H0_MEDTR|nr:hypothetical protein MTR_7g060990 [Medicago truncatula]
MTSKLGSESLKSKSISSSPTGFSSTRGRDNLFFFFIVLLSISTENIKTAIWDCNSLKSPGPDGISFGFIKEFWDPLKFDMMRFLNEFNTNGRIVKGNKQLFNRLHVQNLVKIIAQ